jgi:hypothetical protein
MLSPQWSAAVGPSQGRERQQISPLDILEQVPNGLKKGSIWCRIEGGESLREEVKWFFLNDVLLTVSFLMGGNLP